MKYRIQFARQTLRNAPKLEQLVLSTANEGPATCCARSFLVEDREDFERRVLEMAPGWVFVWWPEGDNAGDE